MEVEQDCPLQGCWWQKSDIVEKVFACLPSNQDVLNCDLVCKEWAALKAPLTHAVSLGPQAADNPAAAAVLGRHLPRIQHLVLRGDATPLLMQLSSATALQSMQVEECSRLQQLPAGLGGLQHLTRLQFNGCPLLQALPPDLSAMTCLQALALLGTPNSLRELPGSLGDLTALQDLRMHGCHLVQEVPDALGRLTCLTRLELDMDCDSPELMPTLLMPSQLTRVTSSLGRLTALSHLTLRGANQLRELPDVFGCFGQLRELKLVGLHALTQLPDSLGALSSLTYLLILGANTLTSLPSTVGSLGSLKHFKLSHCHSLTAVPGTLGGLQSLECFELGCHGLLSTLPDAIGGLTALTQLSIETASLSQLPDSLGRLSALRQLTFSYCHCLQLVLIRRCNKQALPDTIGALSNLELLSIDTCMHLTTLPQSITQLRQLTELRIHNAEAWPLQLPSLPSGLGYLPSLHTLSITVQEGAGDNILPDLPSSIARSTSLRVLRWGRLHLLRA